MHEIDASNAGVRARVHGAWGELELRGVLFDPSVRWNMPTWASPLRVSVLDVLERLDALQRAGCSVVLLRLHVFGGHASAEDALCEALRAFSAAGGFVIGHVDELAASAGVGIALSADMTTMTPGACFAVHRALLWDGAGIEVGAGDPGCEAVTAARLALLSNRTLTPPRLLREWLSRGPNATGQPEIAMLNPIGATRFGWVDAVLRTPQAEQLAEQLAEPERGRPTICTPRQAKLRAPPPSSPLCLVDPRGIKIGQTVFDDSWLAKLRVRYGRVRTFLDGGSRGYNAMLDGVALPTPTRTAYQALSLSGLPTANFITIANAVGFTNQLAVVITGAPPLIVEVRNATTGAVLDPASNDWMVHFMLVEWNDDGVWL